MRDRDARRAAEEPSDRPVVMLEVVFPDQANHYGTLFGGVALALMDKAAFVAASRRARCAVVTAASERVDFHAAAYVGETLEVVAEVVGVGRTSLTVEVGVSAEDLESGERRAVTSGRFVMVAVDEAGHPTSVPRSAED